ncbi:DUF6214 family protein [Streptomyces albus]|uniref:DUF6214 family protein n=1 Tax=Streptomyces albus TaxID=1888 RepID=UPI0033C7B3DA
MSDRPSSPHCPPAPSRAPGDLPPCDRPDPPEPLLPCWQLQGHGSGAGPHSEGVNARAPWFAVTLDLPDGARVDVLAAVVDGQVRVEELRAEPPLTAQDVAALAPWLGDPLTDICPEAVRPPLTAPTVWGTGSCVLPEAPPPAPVRGRGRPPGPRGRAARHAVAEAYTAAREDGEDAVLAVMRLTGHSRRRALRAIAQARDAGLLAPRHARR